MKGEVPQIMADRPISILSSDALEYIFWMNTERSVKPPSALTLIRTSQVCMSWRQLILSSPSLWGQVIDLDYLKNRELRDEIIRRTGQSVISLVSRPGWSLNGDASGLEEVVSFLEQHWSRLKSIDIWFSRVPEWTEYEERIWAVLQRPAPSLANFSFSPPTTSDRPTNPSIKARPQTDLLLFGNYAPQLKIFNAPELTFNPRASWLRYLRELHFASTSTLPDLLLALQDMPLLEILYLSNRDRPREYPPSNWNTLSDVRLPSLQVIGLYFNVKLDSKPYLNFLRHLRPMSLCLPQFSIFAENDRSSDEQNLKEFIEILDIFATFCGLDQATSVDVSVFDDNFEIKVPVRSLADVASLDVGISYSGTTLDSHYKKAFLSTFQRSSFRSMEEVSLIIEIGKVTLRQEPGIDAFVQLFQAATRVQTSPGSANFFQRIPLDALATTFPFLHTIEFSNISSGSWGYQEYALPVQTFVRAMLATGHPIATIYFSIPNEDAVYVTEFKEEFPELHVHLECVKPYCWEY